MSLISGSLNLFYQLPDLNRDFVQAYLWEDNMAVVTWLAEQLSAGKWEQSVLFENIKCVQRDCVMLQMQS